jgi:hypothetical protein
MDPDPSIFIIDLRQQIFFFKFTCILLFEGTFTSFFKDKVKKKSQSSRNQGFSYYNGLMIEGSGSGGSGFGSRSATLFWRKSHFPKNCELWSFDKPQLRKAFSDWVYLYETACLNIEAWKMIAGAPQSTAILIINSKLLK